MTREEKVKRYDELLTAHRAKWESLPCKRCRGKGGRSVKTEGGYDSEWVDCSVCGGTGDLLKRPNSVEVPYSDGDTVDVPTTLHVSFGDGTDRRKVRWHRGFPLVECASSDVWRDVPEVVMRPSGSEITQRTVIAPTSWAAAAAGWAVGFWLTDVTVSNAKSLCRRTSNEAPMPEIGGIPYWLWDAIRAMKKHNQIDGKWMYFDTPDAARHALAIACRVWCRKNTGK